MEKKVIETTFIIPTRLPFILKLSKGKKHLFDVVFPLF
jgi:hypothetical protein